MAEGEIVETKIIGPHELSLAVELLQAGEVVAIPTETVYGLGANGLDEEAINKIYIAKGRPSDNPLILHVPSRAAITPLVSHVNNLEEQLMQAFWPGPLTITFPKSDIVPKRATGGLSRVALRCPDFPLCLDLLEQVGLPIAAPSANVSGKPSPTNSSAVKHDMDGRIAGIVDVPACPIGVESTVVECTEDSITILRPGGITREMLLTICDNVVYDKVLIDAGAVPKAPGMKYTHYAPQGEVTTVVGDTARVAEYIVKTSGQAYMGLIISEEVRGLLTFMERLDTGLAAWLSTCHIQVYGKSDDLASLAHALYESLLRCDTARCKSIIVQGCPTKGLGVAIMNRLEKASAGRIVEV